MKKTKYIPGDLVMSKIHGIGVIQVCSLGGNHVIIRYLNNDITVGSSIDSVKPIPLTKEILEKNEWEKIEFCRYYIKYKFKDEDLKMIYIKRKDIWAFEIDRVGMRDSSILYVHQLQHLLFGLGLNSELKV